MAAAATAASLLAGALFALALSLTPLAHPTPTPLTAHLPTYLGATATSAALLALTRIPATRTRTPLHRLALPLLAGYDGTVLGSVLMGLGMFLSASDPALLPVHAVLGSRSGRSHAWVGLVGAVVGGAAWVRFGARWKRPLREEEMGAGVTLEGALGVRQRTVVALVVGCVGGLAYGLGGLRDGLLVGAAQGASVWLTGSVLGVSSAYEQAGAWVLGRRGGSLMGLVFAVGMMGAAAAVRFWGVVLPAERYAAGTSIGGAVLGGALMGFGSRMAGGCTCGHGISGAAGLSVASFVSVLCIFGTVAGLSALL